MARIPKLLHFCFGFSSDFGGKPFSLPHYVCIRSAIERLQPDKVFLYLEFEPTGMWWDKLQDWVTPIRMTAPREVFGRPLLHPAHRADVTRLQVLIEQGGIYLDVDVFVHRSFDHLLDNSVVLGREGDLADAKLCNAVMLAEPQAPFLRRWLDSYRDFRGTGPGRFWNEHSVLRPARLAADYPGELTILSNRVFFWPLFQPPGLARIFASNEPIVGPETLATHLWEHKAWRRYLDLLTPGKLRRSNTNFAAWATPLLVDLPDDFAAPGTSDILRHFAGLAGDLRDEWQMKFARLPAKLGLRPKRA